MIGKRVNSGNEVAFLNQEIAWMEWPTTSIVTKPSLLFADPCSLDSSRSASANGKIGGDHSLRKKPTFASSPLVSPWNDVWETSAEIPYWWRVITQMWLVEANFQPIRSRWWRVIGMEFLRSFLRRYFAGKPVLASWNVACFLRIGKTPHLVWNDNVNEVEAERFPYPICSRFFISLFSQLFALFLYFVSFVVIFFSGTHMPNGVMVQSFREVNIFLQSGSQYITKWDARKLNVGHHCSHLLKYF